MRKKHTGKAFSLAKITLPKISGVFPRKRLFRTIDEKRNRPVVWVSGPGGSGKTTLVASYLQARKLPHLWYRMDEGDSDPATFFYYLGVAGSKAAPQNHNPMPLLRPEYLQGMPVFALRFFEDLFFRLGNPSIVVFDNYHFIPENSRLQEALEKAFAAIPEGLNVIVISRHAIPKAMIRLQANSAIGQVDWKDLQLTLEETAGIANSKYRDMQPKAIRRLHIDTNGWIAGLLLILENLTLSDLSKNIKKRSRDEIFDYFGNQFFDGLDSEFKQFLLKTAFLPQITVKMAEELTDLPNSGDFLIRLVKNGYFTERDNSANTVYRYHQLMQEFLANRARYEITSKEIDNILEKSARILEASGAIENAAELFVKLSDWENLNRIILDHATHLLAQGRNNVLETWLAAIPYEILDASPWLLYWKAGCLGPYKPIESVKLFEKAFTLFEEQGDGPGTLLSWSGTVDSILLAWDDFTPLASRVEWLDAYLSEHTVFPSKEIEARVASSVIGVFTWALPSRPDIKDWLKRALRLMPDISDESIQLQVMSNSFTYFFWNGDIENMKALVKRAKIMARSSSATPLSIIMCKIMEIRSRLILSVDYESCLELAEEALDLSEKHGIYVRNNSIYSLVAAAALSINNLQMVRKFLRKMDALTLRTPRGMSNMNQYIAGWYYFLEGNLHTALTLSEKGLEVSLECRSLMPEILFRQLIIKIHYEMGEYKTAFLEVTRTKEIISGMNDSPMLLYFSLFDEALVLFGLNKESAAEEALRSAMGIGVKHDYRTTMLYWRPAFLVELCKKSLEKEIETGYVRNLIRSLRLVPEKPPYEINGWPWTVMIYTLGEFRIVCNGSPLEFSRKAQKKPLELLKSLLTLGGKGVREEAITDILWPESDGDAAHHSFEMNLKRLRDLLGDPETLQLRDRRLTLNDRLCWVDSWAFDRFIKGMKDKKPSGNALLAARQAVDIYTGHFLSGETDTTYAISLREQLRSKYLWAVQWLGNQLEISKKWQEAAEYYERGLQVDDLAEELYRRLIYCHTNLGKKSEALLVYKRCKKILSMVLGIEPSKETQKLYQSLKTKEGRLCP